MVTLTAKLDSRAVEERGHPGKEIVIVRHAQITERLTLIDLLDTGDRCFSFQYLDTKSALGRFGFKGSQ